MKPLPAGVSQQFEDDQEDTSVILGRLRRGDWELWVSLESDASVYLSWWIWREDLQSYDPLVDFGGINLQAVEFLPLAKLLHAVGRDPLLREGVTYPDAALVPPGYDVFGEHCQLQASYFNKPASAAGASRNAQRGSHG